MTARDEPLRLELVLERNARPIQGRVGTDGGWREFSGWLELAASLEREFEAARSAPGANAMRAKGANGEE